MAIFEGCHAKRKFFVDFKTSKLDTFWTQAGPKVASWRSKIVSKSISKPKKQQKSIQTNSKSQNPKVRNPFGSIFGRFWGRFWSKFRVKHRLKIDHFSRPAFLKFWSSLFDEFLTFLRVLMTRKMKVVSLLKIRFVKQKIIKKHCIVQ